MINHFYWWAFQQIMVKVILEKWLLLINHMHNKTDSMENITKSVHMDICEQKVAKVS